MLSAVVGFWWWRVGGGAWVVVVALLPLGAWVGLVVMISLGSVKGGKRAGLGWWLGLGVGLVCGG